MANSFYVPGSLSGSYVASKRTEEGSLAYPAAETEIGIQKQAALQDLSKQYETTIENAYSSYLASQRNVMESAMGQGYKEQYLEAQDQALAENLAQINANIASTRAELEAQESEAKSVVQEQYKQEVANLDRTAASFQNYLDYVKDLSYTDPETNETMYALDPVYSELGLDYLYENLYGLQPRETGIDGMSYAEWLQANVGSTKEDQAWYQWAQAGGLQDFLSAVRARPDYQTAEQKLQENKVIETQNKIDELKTKASVPEAVIDYKTNPKKVGNNITYVDTDGKERTASIIKSYESGYDDYEMSNILNKIGVNNNQGSLTPGAIYLIDGKTYIIVQTGNRKSMYEIE